MYPLTTLARSEVEAEWLFLVDFIEVVCTATDDYVFLTDFFVGYERSEGF